MIATKNHINKKILILDIDGVVIIGGERFSSRFSRQFNVPYSEVLKFFKNEFKGCVIGTADLKKVIRPYLKKWGWKKSLKSLLEYWFEGESIVNWELISYVRRLRDGGTRCYIATNQERYRSDFIKNIMKLDTMFDGMFFSWEMGVKKPKAKFYKQMIKRLKIDNPKSILFWDDEKENVNSARKLGIGAYIYRNYEQFRKKIDKIIAN